MRRLEGSFSLIFSSPDLLTFWPLNSGSQADLLTFLSADLFDRLFFNLLTRYSLRRLFINSPTAPTPAVSTRRMVSEPMTAMSAFPFK